MSRVGIITGMIVEAAHVHAAAESLPQAARPLVAAVGGSPCRARRAALDFADRGVDALISFGVAGGLEPGLRPGDIVFADTVCRPDGLVISLASGWREAAVHEIGAAVRVRSGSIVCCDAAITTVRAKAALHDRTGALAVDMESHGVAAAAAERGLPVLAVRAVADPAERAVPGSALAGLGPDGRRRPIAVLCALVRNPSEIAGLMRIARDSGKALESLKAIAPVLVRVTPD